MDWEGEPINKPGNERKSQNGKQIGKLLLTITVADLERLLLKVSQLHTLEHLLNFIIKGIVGKFMRSMD